MPQTATDCNILPLTGLNASVYTGLNAQKLWVWAKMKMIKLMMSNNDDQGLGRQRRGFLRVLSEQRTPYMWQRLPAPLLMMHQPSKYLILNTSFKI